MADDEQLSFADEAVHTVEYPADEIYTALREACPAHQIAMVWDLIGTHYHVQLHTNALPTSRFKQLVRDITLMVAIKAASAYAKTLN